MVFKRGFLVRSARKTEWEQMEKADRVLEH